MNTTKKIVIALLLICSYSLSEAQQIQRTPSEELQLHKNCIKGAQYIFEGTVIKQECFYGRKGSGVLTCSVIQITKIYKGSPQINLGTIKVITKQGGQVGNGPAEEMSDGGPSLNKGATYIVFGKLADTSQAYQMLTDNNLTMVNIDFPVRYQGKDAAIWRTTMYKNINDLYALFKENGLTVEAAAQQQSESPADSTKH